MLGEITSRVIAELGPWLWMISGFFLMMMEIFSGRGLALSLALAAMIAGTIAILGASGVWPETSNLAQNLVFVAFTLAIFTAVSKRHV